MTTRTPEPNFADAVADPQREAVYEAQEAAMLACLGLDDSITIAGSYLGLDEADDDIPPAALASFMAQALAAAGWEVTNQPTVVLDAPDDSEHAGWHEGATGVIHLHPRLLDRWIVLHELAHWVRPPRFVGEEGHGREFTGVLVGLVQAGICTAAGDELLAQFLARGIEVDDSNFGDETTRLPAMGQLVDVHTITEGEA